MKYIIKGVLVVLMTIVLSGSQTFAQRNKKNDNQKQELQLTATFIDAKKEALLGNTEKAMELYKKCISMNKNHAASYYEMSKIYSEKQEVILAIENAEIANLLEQENKWYKEELANLYNQNGEFKKAGKLYEELVETDPGQIDYLFTLAGTYTMNEEYLKAIDVYSKVEDKIGFNEEITMQKERLYQMAGVPEKATEEVEKLAKQYPSNTRYQSILAKMYMKNKQYDKAFDAYQNILKQEPENEYIHVSLAEWHREQNQMKESIQELKKAFENPRLDFNTKAQVFFAYIDMVIDKTDVQDDVINLSETLVKTHPEEALAHIFYAEQLGTRDSLNAAIEQYKVSLSIDSSKFTSWQNMMLFQIKAQKFKDLQKDSERAMMLFPFQPLPFLFNGMSSFNLKNYDRAIKSLNKGKTLVVDNHAMLEEFYTYLGYSYHETKEYKKEDEIFDKLLKMSPNNALHLNNYAYYLSLRNQKLDKAENLIKRALKIEENNSYYLDTYGWVLYKKGEYKQAKVWLLKALEADKEDSAAVLEHLGDVLYQLGDKNEALNYWIKAKEAGEKSEHLEEKINQKKLIE